MTSREQLELQAIHREVHRALDAARFVGDHAVCGHLARLDEMIDMLRHGPAHRNARYVPPDERLRIATAERQEGLDREAADKRAQYARRRARRQNHAE